MTLDPQHELLLLAERIAWQDPRLLCGLHLLGVLRGLSDAEVCAQWVENPYFQAFCGKTGFAHTLAVGPAELAAWRAGMGEALAGLLCRVRRRRPCS